MTVVMWIIVIVLMTAFVITLFDSVSTKLAKEHRLINLLIAVVAFACLMYVYSQYTGGIVL